MRRDNLEPEREPRYLGWIVLAWACLFGGILYATCDAAPLNIAWTNPTTEAGTCDSLGAPLLDGQALYVEWRKNIGPWVVVPGSLCPLVPGAPMTRTLDLSGGVWKIRVVCRDDAGLESRSCHEIWAVSLLGRVWTVMAETP